MSIEKYDDFIKGVGQRLRKYRKEIKGLSQKEFGDPINKSVNAIKNYEKGPPKGRDFKIPLEILFQISDYYNIRLEWLLFDQLPIEKKKKKKS